MKKYAKAIPGKGIVASRILASESQQLSDEILQNIANEFVMSAIEEDGDYGRFSIKTPNDAANAGLRKLRREMKTWEPDDYEYYDLPSDFKLTRDVSQQIKSIMIEVANDYGFD